MFRCSPIRLVNGRPLPRTVSPMPPSLLQRASSSALPRNLPPHLVEKNKRVEFLRKLGLGRRRADQIARRSYNNCNVDKQLRIMMEVPPLNDIRLQKSQDTAMLETILNLVDPRGTIPMPMIPIPVPQAPSPQDINWIDSPSYNNRSSKNSFYNYNSSRPLFEAHPNGEDILGPSGANGISNGCIYNPSPNQRSSPYIGESPIFHQDNPFYSRGSDHLPDMEYVHIVTNKNVVYHSYTDESGSNRTLYFPENRVGSSSLNRSQLNNPNDHYDPDYLQGQPVNEPIPTRDLNSSRKRKHPQPTLIDTQLFSKRQRRRGFYIGGYRLPYTNSSLKDLPQPENKSLMAKFFMTAPNYIIGSPNPETEVSYAEGGISDDESQAGDLTLDEEGNPLKSNELRCVRHYVNESLCLEWVKIYRPKNYRNWYNWWKDFIWCNAGIDKQLEKYNGYNLKSCFTPNVAFDQEDDETTRNRKTIKKMLRSAHLALVKNRNCYFHNMRTIYRLMCESFLKTLSLGSIEQLLDIIRSVPNHLWVYKMRSVVYIWSKYWELHTKVSDGNDQNVMVTANDWNSPVFHWLAKRAISELMYISRKEWTGHNDFFAKQRMNNYIKMPNTSI